MDKSRFYFLIRQYVYIALLILLIIQVFFPAGGLETDEHIKTYWIVYLSILLCLFFFLVLGYFKMVVLIKKIQENKVYKTIDILFCNLVILLFLSETILFVLSTFTSEPLFAMNPWTTSWINHVRPPPYADFSVGRANSEGYIDTEFSETKDNKTYRIIGLGDSFSFGSEYKYFPYTLLEAFLNNNSKGTTYEVYNMGVGATDPNHYYQIYQESIKYNPDLVIVTLYVGNDFTMELFGRSSNIFKRSSWYTYAFLKRLHTIYSKLDRQQAQTDNIYYYLPKNSTPELLPQDGSDLPSQEEILKVARRNMENKMLEEVNLSEAVSLYNMVGYREVQKTWEKNKIKTHFYEIMEIIKKMNEEMNGRFILVIAPDIIQIDDEVQNLFYEYLETDLSHLQEDRSGYNFTVIDEKIMEYCSQNNIQCIDLLPQLREGRFIYYVNENGIDLHWNEWGNYIAAKEEYNAITALSK